MKNFLKAIPKTDLHVHLDGSIRIPTLIDLAKASKIELPSFTEDGLNTLVFKEKYSSLVDYLQGFGHTVSVMQTKENIERIAYEFAQDNIAENVLYVEVRFAPQLHVNAKLSYEEILVAVQKGMERAQKEFNNSVAVTTEGKPPFHFGIIVCAMRSFGKYSDYFANFIDSHRFSKPDRIHSLASFELAQAAVDIRDRLGVSIVGFDLAGAEAGNPAVVHKEAYQYAHKNFIHATVHAGEAYGAESIFQAITDLYAERIGHGYYLFDEKKISDPDILDPKKYIHNLTQFIADKRVTIEVCLTSNMQTNPDILDIKDHQFKNMLASKLSTTICTDNRTVSKTTVTKELGLASEHFGLKGKKLKDIVIYGFKRSFYPGTYVEKRDYTRKVINYYEKIENEFFKS